MSLVIWSYWALIRVLMFVCLCFASFNMHLSRARHLILYDRCNVQKPILTRPIPSGRWVRYTNSFNGSFFSLSLSISFYILVLLLLLLLMRLLLLLLQEARERAWLSASFFFTTFIQFAYCLDFVDMNVYRRYRRLLIIPTVNWIKSDKKEQQKWRGKGKIHNKHRTNAAS